MFYTYVIKSTVDNRLYTGWTDNIEKRLKDHNEGRNISTKNRAPFVLVYYEACLSKSKAVEREKQLKTGFGRSYLKRRL